MCEYDYTVPIGDTDHGYNSALSIINSEGHKADCIIDEEQYQAAIQQLDPETFHASQDSYGNTCWGIFPTVKVAEVILNAGLNGESYFYFKLK